MLVVHIGLEFRQTCLTEPTTPQSRNQFAEPLTVSKNEGNITRKNLLLSVQVFFKDHCSSSDLCSITL